MLRQFFIFISDPSQHNGRSFLSLLIPWPATADFWRWAAGSSVFMMQETVEIQAMWEIFR
jgi:hypothetical protein